MVTLWSYSWWIAVNYRLNPLLVLSTCGPSWSPSRERAQPLFSTCFHALVEETTPLCTGSSGIASQLFGNWKLLIGWLLKWLGHQSGIAKPCPSFALKHPICSESSFNIHTNHLYVHLHSNDIYIYIHTFLHTHIYIYIYIHTVYINMYILGASPFWNISSIVDALSWRCRTSSAGDAAGCTLLPLTQVFLLRVCVSQNWKILHQVTQF